MRRYLLIPVLILAACGGSVAESPSTTSEPDSSTTTDGSTDSTETRSPDTSQSPDTTRQSDEPTTTTSDLPLAPDFTLELGTGGEYRLSDTDNPVYLVFWAEW